MRRSTTAMRWSTVARSKKSHLDSLRLFRSTTHLKSALARPTCTLPLPAANFIRFNSSLVHNDHDHFDIGSQSFYTIINIIEEYNGGRQTLRGEKCHDNVGGTRQWLRVWSSCTKRVSMDAKQEKGPPFPQQAQMCTLYANRDYHRQSLASGCATYAGT